MGATLTGLCGRVLAAQCEEQWTTLRCARCRLARYCCAEHQKQHWKEHKDECEVWAYLLSPNPSSRLDLMGLLPSGAEGTTHVCKQLTAACLPHRRRSPPRPLK